MWLPRRLYWELWANRAYRRDCGRSAALIGPTAAFAREFEAIVPEVRGRVRMVHHGVAPLFGPGIGARAAIPALLFVGNDMVYKNLVGALRIFARAAEGLPHELRVAGVGPDRVRRLARQAGVEAVLPRVRALGPIDEARLSLEYRAASALLAPSLVESFGMPVLEAMASGLPVACSDLPSLREVAGGAALHAAPADEAGFAASVREILCDGATAAGLAERGIARARAFSWTRAARETAAVLHEVASRRHGIL
jgi:glycosyltransferase involved in cell wall biosynthesis